MTADEVLERFRRGLLAFAAELEVPVVPPPPPPPPPADPDVTTLGPGLVEYDGLHVHAGKTLVLLPGIELVRRDVPVADPDHTDGGIVVHGTLVAVRRPGEPPIVIRSANPADPAARGHMMFHQGSVVRMDGVEVVDMGRSRVGPFGADNPKGRYAVHFHEAEDATGSYVRNCVVRDTVPGFRHGVVIHGPCRGLVVEGNHVRHKGGTGIYLEDGREEARVVGNLVEDILGSGGDHTRTPDRADARGEWEQDGGFNGSGIYCRGPLGRVVGNTVRRCPVGYTYYQRSGPTRREPIAECRDNTAEDCHDGFVPWAIGGHGDAGEAAAGPSVFERFTIRRCRRGVFPYEQTLATWRGFRLEDAPVGSHDYTQTDLLIEDGVFVRSDLSLQSMTVGRTRVVRCHFDGCSVVAGALWYNGPRPDWIAPRETRLVDCTGPVLLRFRDGLAPPRQGGFLNLIQTDRVYVESGGVVRQAFASYQDPDAICPASDESARGCPEAGLTNREALARHGVCRAGAVTPPGAVAVPWVRGGKVVEGAS